MPGMLYPAYQKFYSALANLDRFNKEANFFDNISCLDSFFSEYRNITFVLQKSLKHTDYFEVYEKNRDRFLTDHWFVDMRNETTKETPIQLIKDITIVVFTPSGGFSLLRRTFSVEDDAPLDSLLQEIKNLFAKIHDREVFFSAYFSFHTKDDNIDLLKKALEGVKSMRQFMAAMDETIGEKCSLCDELKERTNKIKIQSAPIDFLLVNDYTYYPDIDKFDRADRFSLMLASNEKNVMRHLPISSLTASRVINFDGTTFGNFTLLHAILRFRNPNAEIFPAIMIVYGDGTYDLDAFQSSMKTTLYRKINEAAELILSENVVEVCYMSLYSVFPFDPELLLKTAKERLELAPTDLMVCASIDKDLNEKEYVFDGKKMEKPEYVGLEMKKGHNPKLNISRNNLLPILHAFKYKKDGGNIDEALSTSGG